MSEINSRPKVTGKKSASSGLIQRVACHLVGVFHDSRTPAPWWVRMLARFSPEVARSLKQDEELCQLLRTSAQPWTSSRFPEAPRLTTSMVEEAGPGPLRSRGGSSAHPSRTLWPVSLAFAGVAAMCVLLISQLPHQGDDSAPASGGMASAVMQPAASHSIDVTGQQRPAVRTGESTRATRAVVPAAILGIPARGINEVSVAVGTSYQTELEEKLENTQKAVIELPARLFPEDLRRSTRRLFLANR